MLLPAIYCARSVAQRPVRTALTVLAIAAVVSLFTVMTAASRQMQALFASTGRADEVVAFQAGAASPELSAISREASPWLASNSHIAFDESGAPQLSPEVVLLDSLGRGAHTIEVRLRAVEPQHLGVYREMQIVQGGFRSDGVMVGARLARTHGLALGDAVSIEGRVWPVRGVFEAPGTLYEQEVWIDLGELSAAAQRTDLTSFTLRARSPAEVVALVGEINANRSVRLSAMPAVAAYARIGGMSRWMTGLTRFIILIVALGAALGGMNVMYSRVASRQREIAILRVVGYRAWAVIVALLGESLLVGVMGGVIGVLLARAISAVPFDIPHLVGNQVEIRWVDVCWGLALAAGIGALGGALPAIHGARRDVLASLAR